MKKFIFALFALLFVCTASTAHADSGQYGQGETPAISITVDKKVSNGSQTKGGVYQYVDNFTLSDERFSPGQNVYFLVTVKNTTNSTLSNIQVTDTLPQYLAVVEAPGTTNGQTISWKYDSLSAGEERTERLIARIVEQEYLPAGQSVMCPKNQVSVSVSNSSDYDTSQFCIEKQVVGVEEVPKAGPEFGILLGALNLAGLGLGLKFRKVS